MKICCHCRVEKPVTEFYGRKKLDSYCKPCKKAQVVAYKAERLGKIMPGDAERFWSHVTKTDTCWNWNGSSRNSWGYGQFWIAGRNTTPHLAMYLLAGVTIPEGLFVDHMCRNRRCVNPDHLRFVTPRINGLENNDSPLAVNARKTHCTPRGHEFTPENTYVSRTGGRQCKACRRELYLRNRPAGDAR